MSEGAPSTEEQARRLIVEKITTYLGTKDDTSRLVGLALLKSFLDNSPEVRSNEDVIITLWESIPSKFLDRLMRTASNPSASSRKDSGELLDLAVSVLHTFTALLPDHAKQNARLLDRIPRLVASLLQCSNDSTRLALETLVSLVSQPEGAKVFTSIEDLSPLTEIAPSQPLALDALLYAWLNTMTVTTDKRSLGTKIDSTIGSLVSSFKGTDAVTLLSFLARLLPRLDPGVFPQNPKWLPSLAKYIYDLVASRPTAAGRAAFTNLSAALLEAYPLHAPQLLFAEQGNNTDHPFSYLLINLLLVDLRATLPTLLEQLNSPQYPDTSTRLTSAFNVVSHFIGYLVRSMDAADTNTTDLQWVISPDLLLKLRTSISETLSLTTEYLRDRWDASVAGAMGLHPDARTGTAKTSTGTHFTLAWDSKSDNSADDPLILAAIRALAIWLREDDNELLRKEAAGLADMLVELYRNGGGQGKLDFRRPVLVAFEGIIAERRGVEAFLENGGWEALAGDLLAILEASSSVSDEDGAARGVEIVRVLLQIAEEERSGPREAWMDLVTRVAGWHVPDAKQPGVVEECQVAALQLITTLLANTHRGVQKRYVHSTSAVLGIAGQLRKKVRGDGALEEALVDVVGTLAALR